MYLRYTAVDRMVRLFLGIPDPPRNPATTRPGSSTSMAFAWRLPSYRTNHYPRGWGPRSGRVESIHFER
jgi:hypothetical protein